MRQSEAVLRCWLVLAQRNGRAFLQHRWRAVRHSRAESLFEGRRRQTTTTTTTSSMALNANACVWMNCFLTSPAVRSDLSALCRWLSARCVFLVIFFFVDRVWHKHDRFFFTFCAGLSGCSCIPRVGTLYGYCLVRQWVFSGGCFFFWRAARAARGHVRHRQVCWHVRADFAVV